MILCNSYYSTENVSDGGEDELGRPLEVKVEWSAPLPCRIETNRDTRKGVYEDGKFRQAEFTMLIDGIHQFLQKRVKLSRLGELLGEYNVVTVEPLEAVDATKIILAK